MLTKHLLTLDIDHICNGFLCFCIVSIFSIAIPIHLFMFMATAKYGKMFQVHFDLNQNNNEFIMHIV